MYILSVIILVIGFVLLVKGADFFVDGSGSLAKKFRVPDYRCHGNQRTGMRRQHFRIVERQQWNGHQ